MSNPNGDDQTAERPTRRPYESPRVVDTAEFETLALGCGKVPSPDGTGSPDCEVFNPQAS